MQKKKAGRDAEKAISCCRGGFAVVTALLAKDSLIYCATEETERVVHGGNLWYMTDYTPIDFWPEDFPPFFSAPSHRKGPWLTDSGLCRSGVFLESLQEIVNICGFGEITAF